MKQLLICSLILLSGFSYSQTPEERGLEIAQMMKSAGEGFISDSSEMEMILIDSYGTRVSRKMKGTSMEGANGEDHAEHCPGTFQRVGRYVAGLAHLSWYA